MKRTLGENTAVPSDNESEISEGTWVVDCRSTTDSRRKRRTPNRKIESGAVNILEKHGDKNINSVEDRLWDPMLRAFEARGEGVRGLS